GDFDCLIGINLLREGLDLPEVALVAILDADKEGFLRNETSLIQTCGRAARNVEGRVLFYADTETQSIRAAIAETERRRAIQQASHAEHGIPPTSGKGRVEESLHDIYAADFVDSAAAAEKEAARRGLEAGFESRIEALKADMLAAAEALDFERAAALRDEIFE